MSKYINLYEQLRKDIIDGIYPPGSKIPSKRVTADNYSVSIITVEHALELLEEEGYISSKERSGYFVTYDINETDNPDAVHVHKSAKIDDANGVSISSTMASGNSGNDAYGLSYSTYAKKVRKVLTEYSEEILVRSPGFGIEKLRRNIASYLERSRHIKADYSQIIIGSGAEYLYGLIVRTLGREKIYGIESPSYKKIEQIYTTEGVKIDNLVLDKNGIKSSSLKNTGAEVLHITPYRSFPTGITATAAKKREYLEWAVKKDAYIIEDDFESEFSPSRKSEETLYALDKDGKVIYINTFSRTIGEAVRVAYMVLPPNLVDEFAKKIGFYNCTVPTFNQYVIAELMADGDFERHLNRVRRQIRSQT